MKTISENEIVQRLRLDNPWWEKPHRIDETRFGMGKRAYFDLLFPQIRQERPRRAAILMGPRRVGKTVMMHQAIQELINGGTPPAAIGYADLQTPLYNGLTLEKLMHLAISTSGTPANSPFFMFYDEIQYLQGWETQLKNAVDHFPRTKFIASGSAAAALRLKSNESGAGRFSDFLLPPVTFYEYCQLIGLTNPVTIEPDDDGDYLLDWDDINDLNKHFIDYLNFGGYPEVIFSDEIQRDPGRYVRSDIIEKVLLRDLPSLYGIHDVQDLYDLFTTLAYNTACEVSLDELSGKSGIAKNTIKRYIEYLESAFLIKIVHRVDRSAKKFKRANFFKVYLTNPCMRSAIFAPLDADDDAMGSLVETGVFAQWFHSFGLPLHYARWTNGEVDIVRLSQKELRPYEAIEVRWTDRHVDRHKELKSLRSFLQDHRGCSGLATTRQESCIRTIDEKPVVFLPSSAYCYFVGWHIIKDKRAGVLKITIR